MDMITIVAMHKTIVIILRILIFSMTSNEIKREKIQDVTINFLKTSFSSDMMLYLIGGTVWINRSTVKKTKVKAVSHKATLEIYVWIVIYKRGMAFLLK